MLGIRKFQEQTGTILWSRRTRWKTTLCRGRSRKCSKTHKWCGKATRWRPLKPRTSWPAWQAPAITSATRTGVARSRWGRSRQRACCSTTPRPRTQARSCASPRKPVTITFAAGIIISRIEAKKAPCASLDLFWHTKKENNFFFTVLMRKARTLDFG